MSHPHALVLVAVSGALLVAHPGVAADATAAAPVAVPRDATAAAAARGRDSLEMLLTILDAEAARQAANPSDHEDEGVAAITAGLKKRHPDDFARFDADHDGSLSRSEIAAGIAELKAQKAGAGATVPAVR